MSKVYNMGPSPHIRTSETVDKVMYDVIIALIPALLMAVYVFKTRALIVTAVSVIFCMLTELVFNKLRKDYYESGSLVDSKIGRASCRERVSSPV